MTGWRFSGQFVGLICTALSLACFGQQPRRLVTAPISDANVVKLVGNTYPLAQSRYDRGPAPASLPLQRMLLVLKRSPRQQAELRTLLAQQQDAASPDFHRWLRPEQFAQRFGLDAADRNAIVGWLEGKGFIVNRIARGGNVIEFSGDAGKVAAAFHTEIHRYVVRGRAHWANAGDPSIPAALAPAVAGIVSLNDFPRHPQHVVAGVFKKQRGSALATPIQPAFTTQCSGGGQSFPCYALGPYDFATIYNLLPLWNAGIDGTGWTLAIAGESDVNVADMTSFRSMFGMPAPVINVIYNGPTPGILQGDETESDLDLEWAGGIARGAAIDFVVSASTDTTSGIDLSSEYIVDNDLAPVMSVSYGACELEMGTAGNQFYDQLWQQAAAEGISVFVAAGDAGSAVCDYGQIAATHGLSVSGLASPPNAVAVGGTDFQEFNNASAYWSSTNDPTTLASAKGYIPEITWNDSCTDSLWELLTGSMDAETNCNNAQLLQYQIGVVGGSGGASNCTTSDGLALTSCAGGYAKPAWQPGNDARRDLPDVSLFAGDGLENAFYLLCEADAQGSCQGGQYAQFLGVGGTSASAPAWAAIQLLVDQKLGAAQGDPHYVLYHLASQQPASGCAANLPPGATCIFPDITVGTIAQPCSTGTPSCITKVATDRYGVLSGFDAAAGFDLATGLGSANVENLVNAWAAVTFAPAKATLTLNPTSGITHGAPVAVTIGVAAQNSGGGTPTGLVSLLTASGQEVATFSLISGAVSGTTSDLPGGTYAVHAHYPGDGVFAPADSAPITVTVAPEASNTTAQVLTADANGNPIAITSQPYGEYAYLRADVAGASKQGVPTGTVTFSINSQAFGSAIPLNSEGTAAAPNGTFLLPGGTDALTAQYSGDASFNASTSPPVKFIITPGPTSLSLYLPANISVGVDGFGNVTINTQSQGAAPTGTLTIQNGGKAVGSPVPVSGATSVGANNYISSQTILNIPAAALNVGLNPITVAYSGDSNYAPASAPPQNIDVQIPTVMALSSSATTINQSGSVTLTAKVTPSQTGPAPMSGTINFSDLQGSSLGSVPVGSGQVQFTASKLPVGSGAITAAYSGDVNYASSFMSVSITVNPDLTLAAAAPSVIISAPGGSGTDTLTATFASSFSGSAQFTCTGLPSEAACSFTPATLSASGNTTLTIKTTAPSLMAPPPAAPKDGPLGFGLFLLALAALGAALAALPHRGRRRRLAAALLLTMAFASCGGGGGGSSSSGGGSPITDPGTPPGVYLVGIVATDSSGATTSMNLTLNVQ